MFWESGVITDHETAGMQHTRSLRHATHPLTCPYNILKTYASSFSLLNNKRTEIKHTTLHEFGTTVLPHFIVWVVCCRKESAVLKWIIGEVGCTRPNLLKKLSTEILKASQKRDCFQSFSAFSCLIHACSSGTTLNLLQTAHPGHSGHQAGSSCSLLTQANEPTDRPTSYSFPEESSEESITPKPRYLAEDRKGRNYLLRQGEETRRNTMELPAKLS
jgi:hypothetical protein